MIDGVPQEMSERRFQLLQNLAVGLSGLPSEFQVHFLVQRACEVTHHARKFPNAIGKRPHSRIQHFVIETRGQIEKPPIEKIQLLQLLLNDLVQFQRALFELCNLACPDHLAPGVQGLAHCSYRLADFPAVVLQAHQVLGEFVEPGGSNLGFTRQGEKSIEIVCSDSQTARRTGILDLDFGRGAGGRNSMLRFGRLGLGYRMERGARHYFIGRKPTGQHIVVCLDSSAIPFRPGR